MASTRREASVLRGVVICLLLAGSACPPPDSEAHVVPGSTSAHLEFRFTHGESSRGGGLVRNLRVRRCGTAMTFDDQPGLFWLCEYAGQKTLHLVRYGIPPEGFTNTVPPKPLTPGCYLLDGFHTYADPEFEFEVRADGSVVGGAKR